MRAEPTGFPGPHERGKLTVTAGFDIGEQQLSFPELGRTVGGTGDEGRGVGHSIWGKC